MVFTSVEMSVDARRLAYPTNVVIIALLPLNYWGAAQKDPLVDGSKLPSTRRRLLTAEGAAFDGLERTGSGVVDGRDYLRQVLADDR